MRWAPSTVAGPRVLAKPRRSRPRPASLRSSSTVCSAIASPIESPLRLTTTSTTDRVSCAASASVPHRWAASSSTPRRDLSLVDNAIVVSDNVFRLMREGVSRVEAAIQGAQDLAIPILTSTLTTIAAFLPMLTMAGNVGEYVSSLPVVVALTLGASYFVGMNRHANHVRMAPQTGPHDRE